jgi:hypothetical protein
MKQLFLIISLIILFGCGENKLSSNGLVSVVESKSGVKFTTEFKNDTTQMFYYKLDTVKLAKGLGRFDSVKAACISYFNDPGTLDLIKEKAFFKWNREGFYALLVATRDKDSNVVFHLATSVKPILIDTSHSNMH